MINDNDTTREPTATNAQRSADQCAATPYPTDPEPESEQTPPEDQQLLLEDPFPSVFDGQIPYGPWLPSPVPSDAELWPGELPFTAFGQWGANHLDKRVFDQDEWWVDCLGIPHLLEEMSADYLRNVIWHLEDNVKSFYIGARVRASLTRLGNTLLGQPSAEYLIDELGFGGIEQLTPDQWLESTPLMRAIRRRTGITAGTPRAS